MTELDPDNINSTDPRRDVYRSSPDRSNADEADPPETTLVVK